LTLLISLSPKNETRGKDGGIEGEKTPVGCDMSEKLNRTPHNVSLCLEKKRTEKERGGGGKNDAGGP